GGSELPSEHARDLRAVRGARPRADDRDRGPCENLGLSRPAEKQCARRIVDMSEQLRQIAAPEPSHPADRLNRGRAHAAAANLFGVRNESASPRCSGSTSAAPARAATVAETRATRARPR